MELELVTTGLEPAWLDEDGRWGLEACHALLRLGTRETGTGDAAAAGRIPFRPML